VLLKLAGVALVHRDIRAGYDYTANIIIKDKDRDFKMQVIDCEIICNIMWFYQKRGDKRYFSFKERRLKKTKGAGAYDFLWQVVIVDWAWIKKFRRVTWMRVTSRQKILSGWVLQTVEEQLVRDVVCCIRVAAL
jgi:hypothetical protein